MENRKCRFDACQKVDFSLARISQSLSQLTVISLFKITWMLTQTHLPSKNDIYNKKKYQLISEREISTDPHIIEFCITCPEFKDSMNLPSKIKNKSDKT